MTAPDVAVVGGGLAGTAAALHAAEAGANVVLFEQRPHLGGAASSFRRGDWELDYGQHVFLRCCSAYRSFISTIGGENHLHLQERLEVPVLGADGRPVWLRRGRLPSPLHLAGAIFRYRHLSFLERLALVPAARALKRVDPGDAKLDEATFGSWLTAHRQSGRAVAGFWDVIALPTLNLPTAEASLLAAVRTFQMGLLTRADAADIGWASVPLSRLHDQLAHQALANAGVEVRLRTRVRAIGLEKGGRPGLVLDGGASFPVGVVIPAVEPRAFQGLFGRGPAAGEAGFAGAPAAGAQSGAGGAPSDYHPAPDPAGLGSSPIVNVHLLFDQCVMPLPLAATLQPAAPWIFDRSGPAGLEPGRYLVVAVSAADRLAGASRGAILSEVVEAVGQVLPDVSEAVLVDSLVIKDRAATIRLRPGTAGLRAANHSPEYGVFPAGSWTDTGWPATMESAVRSGIAAAQAALGIPAEGKDFETA